MKTRKTKWDLTAHDTKMLSYVVMWRLNTDWRDDEVVARTFTLEDAYAVMSTYDEGTTYLISL